MKEKDSLDSFVQAAEDEWGLHRQRAEQARSEAEQLRAEAARLRR